MGGLYGIRMVCLFVQGVFMGTVPFQPITIEYSVFGCSGAILCHSFFTACFGSPLQLRCCHKSPHRYVCAYIRIHTTTNTGLIPHLKGFFSFALKLKMMNGSLKSIYFILTTTQICLILVTYLRTRVHRMLLIKQNVYVEAKKHQINPEQVTFDPFGIIIKDLEL